MGITHVLNAAKGEKISQINTNQIFYDDLNIKFFGCSLMDVNSCKIDNHFEEAIEFIHDAVNSRGKVLVHCYMGVSRSASFIIGRVIAHFEII